MQLTSPAFDHTGFIPSRYTCEGDNVSPPLTIVAPPPGTVSFALIVDDPDAPAGDWVHWLVWNLPGKVTNLKAGDLPPSARQGLNDFGNHAYDGPCPPSGTHRYQFHLYALDSRLDLQLSTKKSQLLSAQQDHVLEDSSLIGLYQRQ